MYTPDVRLYHRAVVVAQEAPLRGLVRQLSIDQLDNESRRVSIYENRGERTPLFTRSMSVSVSGWLAPGGGGGGSWWWWWLAVAGAGSCGALGGG